MSFFGSSRGLSLPPVVKNIIIINIILFAASQLTMHVLHSDFMIRHLALFSLKSPLFEPHQVATHIFMHASLAHIFFNMFGVFMFGRILEQLWGSKKMLVFYTVTGLGAAFIHLTVNYFQMNNMLNLAAMFNNTPVILYSVRLLQNMDPGPIIMNDREFHAAMVLQSDDPSFIESSKMYVADIIYGNLNIPTVGASGAVFGLLIAFAMMFPDVELMLIFADTHQSQILCSYLCPAGIVFWRCRIPVGQCSTFRTPGGSAFWFSPGEVLEKKSVQNLLINL
jgi:membrane associated rhomboid family serine protease